MNRWIVLILSGLVVAGCSRRDVEQESVAEASAERSGEIFEAVNQALVSGETNSALEALQEAFEDPGMESERGWSFQNILDLLLKSGQVDEARERMLAALRENAPYAQNGFGMVYRYYLENKADAERVEWTEALLDAGLSGRMAMYATGWRMVALYEVEGIDSALALVPDCVEEFPENEAKMVLSAFLVKVMARGDYDAAEKALDKIGEVSADMPALVSIVDAGRIRILLAQGKLEDADTHIRACAAAMEDDELVQIYREFGQKADASGDGERLDGLSEFIVREIKGKARTREMAASNWMDAARKADDPAVTVERLEGLLDIGLPYASLARIYRANFYSILDSGNTDATQRLMEVGDRLMKLLPLLSDDNGVCMLLLDGSFLTEDYDRAISLVEKGIPGRDKSWKTMALNKIRAHKALKEGRPEEAIERFRVFMGGVEEWEDDEVDPATGVRHTREMTLGRNAKRIAEIYTSMGKAREASAAYEEAADYYSRALMTVKPDSKEYEIIKSEMDGLPSGK